MRTWESGWESGLGRRWERGVEVGGAKRKCQIKNKWTLPRGFHEEACRTTPTSSEPCGHRPQSPHHAYIDGGRLHRYASVRINGASLHHDGHDGEGVVYGHATGDVGVVRHASGKTRGNVARKKKQKAHEDAIKLRTWGS